MASITFDLSDSEFQKVQNVATMYGITTEVLLKASLEIWLDQHSDGFTQASKYVLLKNAELYQRLA